MLWLKMYRELKENKGAYLGCIVVIIIGLMVFTSFSMLVDNIRYSKEEFYENQNFADGFVRVAALPADRAEGLKNIEGIDKVRGRIVKDVRVLFPGRSEDVYLRLISVDPADNNPVNGMHLIRGTPLDSSEPLVWVDNMFFDANKLNLNDNINIIAGGRERNLQVVGVGQSPEYIYALRTAADFYSSPETFGIAFVPLEIMKSFFPLEQAFNDVVFTLKPEADFDRVKEELEVHLRPYGLINIIPRKDQTSHIILIQELEGLASLAMAVPVVFLSIAALIMFIMLKRIIEQQRGQIGILKAFGYTQREIVFHYLSYALTIGVIGGIAGGLAGIAASSPFTVFYGQFFNIPGLGEMLSPWHYYLLLCIFLAVSFSFVAGYLGSKKVLKLEPAEAMRPPAPLPGKKILLERISLIWEMFTVQGMMAVRNLSRNIGRSGFIFLGIMFCFAISSFTWSMNDLFQQMVLDQYEKVEVYDLKVSLEKPLGKKNVYRELQAVDGVKAVEAMAEIPVNLKNKWHQKNVVLLGLPSDSNLYNIMDENHNRVEPPREGLLLSERLAMLLDAEVGTVLYVEDLMPGNFLADRKVDVTGIIPQYIGMNAYMELNKLQDFLGQGDLATAFMLSIDKNDIPRFQEKYLQSNVIASIDEKEQQLAKLEEMVAVMSSVISSFALIGVIIGFSVIYSSSIITLSERSRELASMMVLGMTPKEVLSVITFEQWFICGPAMAAGIPLSQIILWEISRQVSNDVYTIPVIITNTSYLMALLVTALSIWIAQRVIAFKIEKLSLVEVLKSRE